MYQPERREMEQRDVRIEATRPERRISLDFDRIEQRRSDPQRETRDTREQERDNNPRSIERPRERQDERGESQRREITPQPERKGREQLSRPSSSESQRPAFDPRRIERKEPQAERKIERNNAPQPKVRREPAKPSSEQRSSQSSGRSQSTGKKRGQWGVVLSLVTIALCFSPPEQTMLRAWDGYETVLESNKPRVKRGLLL
jgi:hypothetical protein